MIWQEGSDRNDAIVKPVVSRNTPRLGETALLVSSQGDLHLLGEVLGIEKGRHRPLFMSRLYPDANGNTGFSVTGPIVGAPYAAILLETLIAWGARKFFFLGWCGAVSPTVSIGDIVVPSSALIDEGTSRHYSGTDDISAVPPGASTDRIRSLLDAGGIGYHEGAVWSTDAIYRETPEKVEHFQKQGALAVEMEVSALFTVGHYHGVDVGALLVVSDELSRLEWRPGFKDQRFRRSRETLCQALFDLCQKK